MFRVALKIVFFCKLAKDQPFDNCQLKTPQGRTLNTTKNGDPVIDSETGDDVFDQNVRALLELEDGQEVCGLQFDEFSTGQLISECLFDNLEFSKKPTKNLTNFCLRI